MSAILYWHRNRYGVMGQCNRGKIDGERDRQARQRTYWVRRGDAEMGQDPKLFYVTYRDRGPQDFVAPIGPFRRLRDAQAGAQEHLDTNTPKIKLELKGRNERGDLLVWQQQKYGGTTLTSLWVIDADEFYAGMVR